MGAPKLADAGEFDLLERAVRETPRGRVFLDEYARRARAHDTDRVLAAIARLGDDRTATGQLDVLRRELEVMAASIAQTRREIAAVKPEAAGNRIVEATEELDYIVRSTEGATAEILTAAEGVQTIAGNLRSSGAQTTVCDDLETHATNLMIACSFQDLTGQRVTKVVNALRYLEQRVNTMIEIWGLAPADAVKTTPAKAHDTRPDAHLLNGPPRDGEGVLQADVDRLLNDAPAAAANATASQDDIDQLFK